MTCLIGMSCTSTSNIDSSSVSGSIPCDIVRFPCGSMSMHRTRCPSSAKAAARFSVVVVFATPPFWLAKAITLATARSVRCRRNPSGLPRSLGGRGFLYALPGRGSFRSSDPVPASGRVDRAAGSGRLRCACSGRCMLADAVGMRPGWCRCSATAQHRARTGRRCTGGACAPSSVASARHAGSRATAAGDTDELRSRTKHTPDPGRSSVIDSRPVAAPCTGGCAELTFAWRRRSRAHPHATRQLDRTTMFEKGHDRRNRSRARSPTLSVARSVPV